MSRDADIEQEVAALGDLPRRALAVQWRTTFGAEPASDISAPLMRKAFAWEIQARALGGHSAKTLRALKAAGGGKAAAKPAGVGSRLIREWNGATYEVEVLAAGYRWRGETWASLTAIAREITGANWSGPRFFGLVGRS